MKKEYIELITLSKKAAQFSSISMLLGWDQETYMPEGAASFRSSQLELLAETTHEIKTSTQYKKALFALVDDNTLKEPEKSIVRLLHRDYIKDAKLPKTFVKAFAKATSDALFSWQKAKKENKFSYFAPAFSTVVTLLQEKAEYLGYEKHPYDALVDEYEPNLTTEKLDELFSEIVPTSHAIIESHKTKKSKTATIKVSEKEQKKLAHQLLELLGFDFSKGRLDLSSHPFSASQHPTDSRITTRIEKNNGLIQIFTILHEAGHSFYEMGMPVEFYGTPLCQAASFGIHESQSRFWETRIGRSKAFWKMLLKELDDILSHFQKPNLTQFMNALRVVSPTPIRVDADEVCYPLHIFMRYEIEKELLKGSLKVSDLPDRFNEKMKELLGIYPTNDQEGVLQDIHWSMGAFGYFPTYALGNIYASQLFDAFEKAHPDWEQKIEKKEFFFIKEWLEKNIWKHARRYDPAELIKKATGKKLSSNSYTNYLKRSYSST